MDETLPVVVIGAGPQGLAAAAHLLERGIEAVVIEAGPQAAAAVREWGHVRLFSKWDELVDPAAARLLSGTGWSAPAAGFPRGIQWVEQYLQPLADALGDRVRTNIRVTGVSRRGRDRIIDAERAEQPFTVHLVDEAGAESRIEARAVLDASGNWSQPNPAGADGLPALGEKFAAAWITYRVPTGPEVRACAGKHIVVVGSGHSAMTAVNDLARIARIEPGTRVTWLLRRGGVGAVVGGAADELPARGALGIRAQEAVTAGLVEQLTGFRIGRIEQADDQIVVVAEDGREVAYVDRLVVLTGFRPDLSFLSEVRLDLDPTLQAPRRVAAEVDPNIHSCGTVQATGALDLAQPEPDFYLLGAKSYGRAPTFLAMTGYEQVRSVVAMLAGDRAGAARVELSLPETGVCGGSGLYGVDGVAGSCCTPTPALLQIGLRPVGAR